MRRARWVLAGVGVLGLTWACWPGEEAGEQAASTAIDAARPSRSLAEQLDQTERELAPSQAERGRVSGLVVDEAGQPVAGAEVRVFQAGGHALDAATCPVCSLPILECTDLRTAHEVLEIVRSGRGQPRQLGITTSGPDGVFQFEDLPQEGLGVVAREGQRIVRTSYVPGAEAVLILSLPLPLPLRVVRGVPGSDGPFEPLPGAKVTAFSLDTFRLVQAVSDGAGQLRLDGLDEGRGVWVLAEAPGVVAHLTSVYSDLEETELALSPSRALLVRTAIAGRPADALVTLASGVGQHPLQQQTQAGSARFDGLGEDDYEVTAATESMVAVSRWAMLDQELTILNLELRPAAKLLVTVIDEAGDPVAEAEVTAAGQAGDFHSAVASDGALAVLAPLGEGPVTVEVSAPGFRPWKREIELRPGENTLEVVVKRGVKLRGTVIDSEGKPVSQAEVEAHARAPSRSIAYSDLDGSFELTFDQPGPQELTASLNTAGRTTVILDVPADGVVIRLEPRARLKVFVHEGSTPIAGVPVTVSPFEDHQQELGAISGDDGWAVISGLGTGRYRLVLNPNELRSPPAMTISLTEGRTLSVDVGLDRGLSVSGRVVDARGTPVVGAEVSSNPTSTGATSDEEGRFTLSTLDPAASYEVWATTELQRSPRVVIKGAQDGLRLVLGPRPMLTGRVVDATTGSPLTRFEVDSTPIAAADGRFAVPQLGDEELVEVTISADGFESVSWEGARGASGDIGTVRLPKAKQIEGVVRDARGNPVAGALVKCSYSLEEVTTGTDGRFHLSLWHYEAELELEARRGQLKGAAPVQLGGVTEIILKPPTRVLGQVVDADGRPAAGEVTVREETEAEQLQVDAASDGSFTIDLAQGRWTFLTRVSASGQTIQVSGPSMRVVLGAPPGSCAIAIVAPVLPDELMLLPGDAAPGRETPIEQLAAAEGTVLFDTTNAVRMIRAGGFRCGSYTLLGRWGPFQRLQRLELRSGETQQLPLVPPPEVVAKAPELEPGHH